MTSKEGTADFADFADRGDAAEGSGWRAKSLGRDSAMLGRHALPLFLIRAIRVIRVIRGYIHPLGAATSRRHCPPRNPKLPGTRRPSPHPDLQSPRSSRRLVVVAPVATQNFLGRDVPAPTRSINYFGVGDVPSPHVPHPRNARHQPGTSPALPQPVFKTLKGFQTVAGGKAARPPPPVPRPQKFQPPPLAEGVGGGGIPESPQAGSPDESRCSARPRRRKKAHEGAPRGSQVYRVSRRSSFKGK